MPPLEDARDLGDVIMDGSTSVLNQSYHDERVYQDHRSVHLHSVEPAAYEQMAQMAVQARVSDLRNEAQQVVTGVVSEAERAVRSAQSEASHANMRAEATHALANQEVEHLRRQLEQVMSENQELRARCFQQRPDPLNGAGMFTARMIAMEERMRVLEDQLNQHHTFIQELWMRPQQSIVSQVHTPANRAQPSSPTHFNIAENENDSGDDEDANNNAEDVESKALRTKDLHHLKPLGTGHGVTPSALRCWPLIGALKVYWDHGCPRLSRLEVMRRWNSVGIVGHSQGVTGSLQVFFAGRKLSSQILDCAFKRMLRNVRLLMKMCEADTFSTSLHPNLTPRMWQHQSLLVLNSSNFLPPRMVFMACVIGMTKLPTYFPNCRFNKDLLRTCQLIGHTIPSRSMRSCDE
jgi:hypothetical protein